MLKLRRDKLWCRSEGYEVAVKWNEWRVTVKCNEGYEVAVNGRSL
jgi:hypothetical protein